MIPNDVVKYVIFVIVTTWIYNFPNSNNDKYST